VALNEEEERILRQIEDQLRDDQRFAQVVSPSGLYRHSIKTIRWAVLGMVVGLVVLIAMLPVHFIFSFVGFLIMLGSGLAIERQVRQMSKVGLADVTASIRNARSSARLKDRFSRDI
jgi:Protein of unknown function (DUF3040)